MVFYLKNLDHFCSMIVLDQVVKFVIYDSRNSWFVICDSLQFIIFIMKIAFVGMQLFLYLLIKQNDFYTKNFLEFQSFKFNATDSNCRHTHILGQAHESL